MKPEKIERKTGRFWMRLFDLISPRFCTMCGSRLSTTEEVICLSCQLSLPRTEFAKTPDDNKMAKLFWGRVPVERAAAWFYYQPSSPPARLITTLKYEDRAEIGAFIGRLAAEEILPTGFFEGIDVLVPIPLTRRRQRSRGYNQSFEIAKGVSGVTGIPIERNAVKRIVFKESQTRQARLDRMENVEGVFHLADADVLCGRHVLVIDDVVTTGATMISCCKELMLVPDIKLSILSMGFTD